MTILKSIWAVLAGFLTVALLSTVTDLILEIAGIFPPLTEPGLHVTWMLALALLYRIAYTVLGGVVTARLAPHSKMIHVWVLAGIGQLAGIGGIFAGWDLSPHWYPIALAATAIPAVWLGGWLYLKDKKQS
jgi:hypothetical protein